MKRRILLTSGMLSARYVFALLFLICAFNTDSAQTASVITFEGVAEGSLNSISYSEAGFKLEDGALSESLYISGTSDGYPSNTIFNSNFDRIIRLRKNTNTVFGLASFDYAGGVCGDVADATVNGYWQVVVLLPALGNKA